MANIIFSEGSNLANSIYGNSQEPIKMFLEKRAEAFEQESIVKQLFSSQPSTHWAERYTSMTAMDGFKPVGENGAYPVDGIEEGPSKVLENVTWKDSFAISREMIDDAQLMDLRQRPQSFITGYYRTREKDGAALIGAGVTATPPSSSAGRSSTRPPQTARRCSPPTTTARPLRAISSATRSPRPLWPLWRPECRTSPV